MDERGAVRVGGQTAHPGDTERLHEYWVHGPGAAKIRWGEPNDFARCVEHLGKFIKDPQGYCNLAHKAALGYYPATHAAMEHKAAGRSTVTTMTERADTSKPYGDVTYADPKHGKYPLDTEAHIRAAWAYVNMPKNAAQYPADGVTLSEVKDRIRAAMKRIGADVADSDSDSSEGTADKASASRGAGEIFRWYTLDDIRIMRAAEGEPSGRVVEAYATVFDTPAEIKDDQGHYMEVIDRAAFDATLARLTRGRGGFGGAVRVLFNHGKTMEGVPAPEFQRPIGKALDIRPDSRGLLTRTEYAKKPFAEEILDDIREGRITGQSFVGGIIRSDPELRGPGDRYRRRNGILTTVRRMMLGLREYGPVLYGAYPDAGFVGVRMSFPGSGSPEPGFTPDEEYSPDMEGDVAGSVPEDTTSARYHMHALYRMTSEEKRAAVGLTF